LKETRKLIFWDIDGTLLHCGTDGRKALDRTFFELYGIKNAFGSTKIGSAMDSMILKGIMESHRIDQDDFNNIALHYSEVLKDVLKENKEKRVLPGVKPILDLISNKANVINALLTSNLKAGAMVKLESVGLGHYFDVGGFGDEPGEKWDVAIDSIKKIENELDISFPKGEIYIIGDSTYDVVCAKKVGMKSIAVGTGWSDEASLKAHGADFYFDDLSDIDNVLNALKLA
jgi:phosphoglycolate phosphatase